MGDSKGLSGYWQITLPFYARERSPSVPPLWNDPPRLDFLVLIWLLFLTCQTSPQKAFSLKREQPHPMSENEYDYLDQALPGFSQARLIVKAAGDSTRPLGFKGSKFDFYRFANRFRLATSFRGMDLEGFTPETSLWERRVVATKGGPAGRALREQVSTNCISICEALSSFTLTPRYSSILTSQLALIRRRHSFCATRDVLRKDEESHLPENIAAFHSGTSTMKPQAPIL